MACVHSLNCEIPFAMDRSRKNEIYYAQSSGMKKKLQCRKLKRRIVAITMVQCIDSACYFSALLLLKSEHYTVQFAMNAIEYGNRKHMQNTFNVTEAKTEYFIQN